MTPPALRSLPVVTCAVALGALAAAQDDSLDTFLAASQVHGLAPGDPDRLVVATTAGRLLTSADGGGSWTLIAAPEA